MMGVLESIQANEFFTNIKIAWSGDDPIYRGRHIDVTADGSETGWQITKYTWDGDNPTDIQVQYGIWNNRASLSW